MTKIYVKEWKVNEIDEKMHEYSIELPINDIRFWYGTKYFEMNGEVIRESEKAVYMNVTAIKTLRNGEKVETTWKTWIPKCAILDEEEYNAHLEQQESEVEQPESIETPEASPEMVDSLVSEINENYMKIAEDKSNCEACMPKIGKALKTLSSMGVELKRTTKDDDIVQMEAVRMEKSEKKPEKKEPVKKYRVNESEIFNLNSMYDHLKCLEIELMENEQYDKLEEINDRIDEVEDLMSHARYIGALVTWPQLQRIREIRDERNAIRYQRAIELGASDFEAGYAIM